MYNLEVKNFHVVNPRTSILTTNANHLGDMVRWGGSGLILFKDKIEQTKLEKNRTIVVDDYRTTIIHEDVVGYAHSCW
jgi:hypothetical protein